MPQDPETHATINHLFSDVKKHMERKERTDTIQLLVSHYYANEGWRSWNEGNGFTVLPFESKEGGASTLPKRYFLEGMLNVADIAIVAWNEGLAEMNGATWEAIETAYERRVPCVWVSTKTGEAYCLWSSYYEPYRLEYLNEFVEPLPAQEFKASFNDEPVGLGLGFWMRLRDHFLAKYQASAKTFEPEQDTVLDGIDEGEANAAQDKDICNFLSQKFDEFDNSAIALNSRFQARLYQRSVLPLITTTFLAFGFYAETLIGKCFNIKCFNIMDAAIIIAGVGFLVHGLLNLYVYRLSKSEELLRQQRDFTNDRLTAEIIRVMLHFMPYGVFIDLRKLCANRRDLFAQLMHLADNEDNVPINTSNGVSKYVLKQAQGMLKDQYAYHTKSVDRYKSIVLKLEKMGKIAFYIGFSFVLVRAVMQFSLVFVPAEGLLEGDNKGILKSALNMFALMLPAWASYYSTKVAMNNFKYNYNNHLQMTKVIKVLGTNIDRLLKQSGSSSSVEMTSNIAEDIAEALIEKDTNNWAQQYMNSTIRPL